MRTSLIPSLAAVAASHIRRTCAVSARDQIVNSLVTILLLVLVLGLLVPVSR